MAFNDRIAPRMLMYTKQGADTAGTDWEHTFKLPFSGEIVGVQVSNGAAITAGDTDYTTVDVKVGSNSVAARSTRTSGAESAPTTGGNWSADTPENLTLTTTTANRKFTSSDVLHVVKTHGGNGVALTDFTLCIFYIHGYEN